VLGLAGRVQPTNRRIIVKELDRVRAAIFEIFVECLHTRLASDEVDLLEGRLVDSVKLVDLVLRIEERFGLTLPFEDLEIEDFRTVSRLAARIARPTPAGL
jgi:acyl carrier protein